MFAFKQFGAFVALLSLSSVGPLAMMASPQQAYCIDPPCIPDDFLMTDAQWDSIPIPGDTGDPCDANCTAAWSDLKAYAEQSSPPVPNLMDMDNNHDVYCLANALVWRGCNGNGATHPQCNQDDADDFRDRALLGIMDVMAAGYNPDSAGILGPGRNVLSYVLAADMIELDDDPNYAPIVHASFVDWLIAIENESGWGNSMDHDGCLDDSLAECHDMRPNNVGLVCGASQLAIDMYLGGTTHKAHINLRRKTFQGWVGNATVYSGFSWNSDQSWQRETTNKGINSEGPLVNGHDIGGAMPEEMRRVSDPACCNQTPTFPACFDPADFNKRPGYVWDALQGAVMLARLLERCLYSPWTWEQSALERSHQWLYQVYSLEAEETLDFDPDGVPGGREGCCIASSSQSDDTWVPHIIDAIYNPSYLDGSTLIYGDPHDADPNNPFANRPGKNCGFADWWALGL